MNVGSLNSSFATNIALQIQKTPPTPEEEAQQLATAVAAGLLTATELQSQLEQRFGTDASSILADDGTLDVSVLTALLSRYAPTNTDSSRTGMLPPPPPPPQGMVDRVQLQSVLTDAYGEEAVAGIFNSDGSIDFEQLKNLLQTNAASSSGNLVDLSV